MIYVAKAGLIIGVLLASWAKWALPPGTPDWPVPITRRTRRGPYRWFKHPMYFGTILMVTSAAHLGSGGWGAFAAFITIELLTREWAWREDQQ